MILTVDMPFFHPFLLWYIFYRGENMVSVSFSEEEKEKPLG